MKATIKYCCYLLPVVIGIMIAMDPILLSYFLPVGLEAHYHDYLVDRTKKNDPNYWAEPLEMTFLSASNRSTLTMKHEWGHPVLIKNAFEKRPEWGEIFSAFKDAAEVADDTLSVSKWPNDHLNHDHVSFNCKMDREHYLTNFSDFLHDLETTDVDMRTGFTSPIPESVLVDLYGFDVDKLFPDYLYYSMFISRLTRTRITAGLHCAPFESVGMQLYGKKTWFFVDPKQMGSRIDHIIFGPITTFGLTDDELLEQMGDVVVAETEPGDVLYFGPNQCHIVLTEEGNSVMFNFRYKPNVPKFFKLVPFNLWGKFFWRLMQRGVLLQSLSAETGSKKGRPTKCTDIWGRQCMDQYDQLDCGPSNRVQQLVEFLAARMSNDNRGRP